MNPRLLTAQFVHDAGVVSTPEVTAALPFPRTTVRVRLLELAQAGIIHRVGTVSCRGGLSAVWKWGQR